MNVLYITDTHLTAKDPASRTDSYEIATLRKLIYLGKVIQKNKVSLVIHGGDMFHSARVSLKYSGMIAKIIRSWGIPVYVVPGNHDTYGYNMNTIDQTTLGFFAKAGVVRLLTSLEPLTFSINGLNISVDGREYYADIDKGNANDFKISKKADYNILVYHGMLLEKPFYPGIPYTLIDDVYTEADMVLAGHYHPGFKTKTRAIGNKDVTFINPGSLLRVESTRLDIPKALMINFDASSGSLKVSYKEFEIKCAEQSNKIFDLQSKASKKQFAQSMVTFTNSLKQLTNLKTSKSVYDMIKDIGVQQAIDQDIIDAALKYIVESEQHNDSISNDIKGFVPKNYKLFIKQVEIKNFQSHEDTIINFDENFNVLVGESGEGKTAALRAILWCLTNQPKGNAFIRTGAKSCSVSITFNDGSKITRKRTNSSSGSYIIQSPTGDIQEYKGFGSNVPIEVINQHQMPEIYIAKDKKVHLNVSEQLEGPFLLCESPVTKLAAIGQLTGVGDIDLAMKNCRKSVLESSKKIEGFNEDIKNNNAKLACYKDLPIMKKYIDYIKALNDKKEKCEQHLNYLKKQQNQFYYLHTKKLQTENALNNIPNTDKLAEIVKEQKVKLNYLIHLVNSYVALNNFVKAKAECNNKIRVIDYVLKSDSFLDVAKQKVSYIEKLLEYYKQRVILFKKKDSINKKIEYYETVSSLEEYSDKVKQIIDKLNKIYEAFCNLNNIVASANNTKNNLKGLLDNIKQYEATRQYEIDSLNKLIKNNKICPLCGQEMTIEHVLGGIE